MKIQPLSTDFGLMIRPEQESFQDLPGDRILRELSGKASGVILLRGFDVDPDAFFAFTETLGKDFLVHHKIDSRDYVDDDKSFATVNKNNHPIDFHNEMAANPIKPDILWLHCVAPALGKGRIGFVDGHKVYHNLVRRTREKLETHGFRYHYRNLPPSIWKPVWGGAMGGLRTERSEVLSQLEAFGSERGVTALGLNDNDELSFDYTCKPIYTAPISGLPVFASGLLDNPGGTLMGDGTQVHRDIYLEVTQASYQNAIWIDWQPGDVVIVDNTRVMHAREAFEDTQRRVLIRYSRGLAAGPSAASMS